jgi:hypothetical protein
MVVKTATVHGLLEVIRAEVAIPHRGLDVAMTKQRLYRDEINA